MRQVCKLGRMQFLEQLIYYGADVNCRNYSGNTPLHVCAMYNQVSGLHAFVLIIVWLYDPPFTGCILRHGAVCPSIRLSYPFGSINIPRASNWHSVSGRKIKEQDHMGPMNFRFGDAYILLTRILKRKCWQRSLTAWLWDFPNASYTAKPMLVFPKCERHVVIITLRTWRYDAYLQAGPYIMAAIPPQILLTNLLKYRILLVYCGTIVISYCVINVTVCLFFFFGCFSRWYCCIILTLSATILK